MALAMDFGFLLEPERQLLSIGFLVAEGALDPNCYDLLASEARLASFFAIAKGDIAAQALVPARPQATPVGQWRGADFVVGIDVRVSDARRWSCASRPAACSSRPTV